MKAVLQFIKSYALLLICGVVGVAAIVFAAIGISSDKVEKAMQKALSETGATRISGLMGKAKNDNVIQVEQRRVDALEAQLAKVREKAEQINRREPLMKGVFPRPERAATPVEFREAYVRSCQRLTQKLGAGTLPTDFEIKEEEQNILDLLELEKEREEEQKLEDSDRSPAVAGGRQPARPAPVFGGGRTPRGEEPQQGIRGGAIQRGEGPTNLRGEGGVRSEGGRMAMYSPMSGSGSNITIPQGVPKYDAVFRAQVQKAKEIRCYVSDEVNKVSSTFHVSPIVDAIAPPSQEDMWFAQVSYWITEDVVRAINDLNNKAAEQVKDGDANVEHMPVKRVLAIDAHGYELPTERIPLPNRNDSGARRLMPESRKSFTGKRSDELRDVVSFSVTAVADERRVLELIDAITRANFFVCVNANTQAVDRASHEAAGYFYGAAPVVLVTLDFEAYMARDVYQQWMPEPILTLLGIKQAEG